jgi:hypothetical protein
LIFSQACFRLSSTPTTAHPASEEESEVIYSTRFHNIGGHLRADPEGTLVRASALDIAMSALAEIANGDGYYGEQAREYKEIAKSALSKLSAPI